MRDPVLDALREVWGLVEDGVLVRNTTQDGNASEFLRQAMRLSATLHKVQTVLSDPDSHEGSRQKRSGEGEG